MDGHAKKAVDYKTALQLAGKIDRLVDGAGRDDDPIEFTFDWTATMEERPDDLLLGKVIMAADPNTLVL